jgi:hypothetical protein
VPQALAIGLGAGLGGVGLCLLLGVAALLLCRRRGGGGKGVVGRAAPVAGGGGVELTQLRGAELQQRHNPLGSAVAAAVSAPIAAATYFAESDGSDTWYVSSATGESCWELPPGAVLVQRV